MITFVGVQNLEFQYFFRVFNKNVCFFGGDMTTLLISLGVFAKFDYSWDTFLCISGSLLKVNVQNGNIILRLLKFKIYFGVSLINIIFIWE